jgi:DNA-binding response OmpR family regulator
MQKDHIMIVASTPQDALDYASSIKGIDKSIEVKALIDEKEALKWAMKHSVKVLIVEDQLAKMGVFSFLKYYRKYILVNPKIILLGNKQQTGEYVISKLLSKNISPRVLAQNVKELLEDSNKSKEK